MKAKTSTFILIITIVISSCSLNDDQITTEILEGTNSISQKVFENEDELRKESSDLTKPDIQITLNWDSSSDIDLYVQDPMGEWIWHKHRKSQSKGFLDKDSRNGIGNENIYWSNQQAPVGSYIVYIKHYGGCNSTYRLKVAAFGYVNDYKGIIKSNQKIYICSFSNSGKISDLQIENEILPELRKN